MIVRVGAFVKTLGSHLNKDFSTTLLMTVVEPNSNINHTWPICSFLAHVIFVFRKFRTLRLLQ